MHDAHGDAEKQLRHLWPCTTSANGERVHPCIHSVVSLVTAMACAAMGQRVNTCNSTPTTMTSSIEQQQQHAASIGRIIASSSLCIIRIQYTCRRVSEVFCNTFDFSPRRKSFGAFAAYSTTECQSVCDRSTISQTSRHTLPCENYCRNLKF